MVRDLVQQAVDATGITADPDAWTVVGDNAHLVLASSDLVLKFWRSESKQRIDTIAHRLAAGHVPVPPLVAVGHVRAPAAGRLTPRFGVQQGELVAFSLYRRVPDAQPAEEVAAGWDAGILRRAYRQAGAWLRALHEVRRFERAGPLAPTGRDWQGVSEDWCGYLLETVARWDFETARHSLPRQDRRLRRVVRDWVLDELPRVTGGVDRLVLCHRDYSFRNLLARPDGDLVAIIDFESALAGDSVFDWHRIAAELLCLRPDRGSWQAFLEGYGAVPGEPGDEQRLLVYLGVYGVATMGYALREDYQDFYADGVRLVAWVAEQIG
ncbi:MAG TPA: aminoglycoside phosphotransferase family protein [Bacillota bacterium]